MDSNMGRSLSSRVRAAELLLASMGADIKYRPKAPNPPKPAVGMLTKAGYGRRNAPCPCGSGHKLKKCCGRMNP